MAELFDILLGLPDQLLQPDGTRFVPVLLEMAPDRQRYWSKLLARRLNDRHIEIGSRGGIVRGARRTHGACVQTRAVGARHAAQLQETARRFARARGWIHRERQEVRHARAHQHRAKSCDPGGICGPRHQRTDQRSGGRPPTRFVESDRGDSAELAYVMTRYRQSHDFYHVVLNKSISIVDELAIKYYEHLQTGLPVGLIAALAGQSRLSRSESHEFWNVLVPWAHMAASSSSNEQMLINVYWEKHIEDDIDQLR
ncbi:Ubiquinone biosynthesis protein coq4, mitochondrial, partial [Smittium culicis]